MILIHTVQQRMSAPTAFAPTASRQHAKAGFTLVELLIIAGVIGILTSTILVALNPDQNKRDALDSKRLAQAQRLTDIGKHMATFSTSPYYVGTLPTSEETAKQVCYQTVQQTDSEVLNGDCIWVNYYAQGYSDLPQDVAEANPRMTGFGVYYHPGDGLIFCPLYMGILRLGEPSSLITGNCGSSNRNTTDATPPTLIAVAPADDSTGVALNSNLTMVFSEAVTPATGNFYIKNSSDAFIAIFSIHSDRISGGGTNVITVNPVSDDQDDLPQNTGMYVEIDATALKDQAGNYYAGMTGSTTWNFTTGSSSDSSAPTVNTYSPADDATDVSIAANLVLTFNEPVVTQAGKSFTIYLASDNSVVESVPASSNRVTGIGTATITINPSTTLSLNTNYYVQIDSGAVEDIAGNDYAGISNTTTWNFTTEVTDSDAPTVEVFDPVDDATDVDVSTPLTIEFNELIQRGTGNIYVKKTSDDSTVATIDATNENSFLINGNSDTIATIDPGITFDNNTGYYVTMDAGVVKDTSNNNFAGISATTTWNFTTVSGGGSGGDSGGDSGGGGGDPVVNTLTPVHGATNVGISANLVMVFDQSVDPETGNITIKKMSDDSTFETIDVTSGKVTGGGTDTITINPAGNLDNSIEYYVEIDATAFDDADSNSYAGISGNGTWSFTTEADTTDPTVSVTVPADNATGISTTANIVLTFAEPVDPETGFITIKLTSDDSTFEAIDVTSGNVTGGGTAIITVNPSGTFANSTEYYVQIDATAFDDAAGNSYAGISSTTDLSFTTEAASSNPTVVSYAPADDSGSVPIYTDLDLEFSENMQKGTGNIEVRKVSDSSLVQSIDVTTADVSITNQFVTVAINDLTNNESYYINIDATALDDTGSDSYAGISDTTTWNFTTTNDTTNPTVNTLSPADNATSISTTANLVITFSENVDEESGNITIKKTSDDSTVETIDVTSGKVTGGGTSTITINPATTLDTSTEYYVQIDATAFDDTVGNSYAGISNTTDWSFTTTSGGDTTPPSVTIYNPAESSTGFSISSNLVLTFDEDIQEGSGDIGIYLDSDDSLFENMSVTGSAVSITDDALTINPSANFAYNTVYYVTIDSGAIEDLAANDFGGFDSDATTWYFTTELDTTNPSVSSLVPADDATDVGNPSEFTINFDENVNKETGNITIKLVSDDSTVETIDVTDSGVTGDGTSQIKFNPSALSNSESYYIQIDATAFDDTSGNSYAGISDTTSWNFTTEAMAGGGETGGGAGTCSDFTDNDSDFLTDCDDDECDGIGGCP